MQRLALILFALAGLAAPLSAQSPPATPVSLFGIAERRQIDALQKQLAAQNAQNAAQFAAIQQQNQLLMTLLLQQKNQPAPAPSPSPTAPIIHYFILPPASPMAPQINPNPGTPQLNPNPGVPQINPNPGTPKINPNPGPIAPIPLNPAPQPPLNPGPGLPGPGTTYPGYQSYSSGPPVIVIRSIPPAPASYWRPRQ